VLNHQLLPLLRCPIPPHDELDLLEGSMKHNQIIDGKLQCKCHGHVFNITHGIPDLIPYDLLNDDEWRLWKSHLDGFQARREERLKNPEKVVTKLGNLPKPNRHFAEFINIQEGIMLDIGCGPGKFRHNFDENKVQYIGLDPIILPEVESFQFVRALAEYIPFADNTFTDVVSLSAIDHFKDLDAFFKEVIRVLKPDGRLHILQSIHEIRGPISAVKMLTHFIKDKLEDRITKSVDPNIPKHLSEFSQNKLRQAVSKYFDIVSHDYYSYKWYSPTKAFMTLKPKETVTEKVKV
jgi:ubiquinone/menaquinone biosynthesis C-methylase UbiE/uncharacterized protein YbaR (Trm112 family)